MKNHKKISGDTGISTSAMGLRITPKVLKSLGCTYLGNGVWEFKSHGIHYSIVQRPGICTDGKPSYDFGTHAITHVEEMIGLAYKDGLEDGKAEMREDFAALMGTK